MKCRSLWVRCAARLCLADRLPHADARLTRALRPRTRSNPRSRPFLRLWGLARCLRYGCFGGHDARAATVRVTIRIICPRAAHEIACAVAWFERARTFAVQA